MSSSSLSQDRLSVAGVINSDTIGLKRFLFEFFTATKLGAIIGPRTQPHETPILFEGPTNVVNRTLQVLQTEIKDKFEGVEFIWNHQVSTQRLESVKIEETPSTLKRSISSGELDEIPLEEISLGGSATTENIRRLFDDAFSSFKLKVASPLGRATGYLFQQHIHITYKGSTHTIEISTKTWDELLAVICKKFTLNSQITSIYLVNNGKYPQATEMSDFIDKETYHIRTEIDQPDLYPRPSFTTLVEFYNALQILGVSATGIATITNAFQSQEIIPSVLSTLTDTKLEKMGITQLGLREAILKVLGSE